MIKSTPLISDRETMVESFGGMENISRAPYLVDKVRRGSEFGDLNMRDSMIHDGLWVAFRTIG